MSAEGDSTNESCAQDNSDDCITERTGAEDENAVSAYTFGEKHDLGEGSEGRSYLNFIC